MAGDSDDVVFDGVPRRHSAKALDYTESGDMYKTKTLSGASLSRGGHLFRREGADPSLMVVYNADMYALGSTVSGALHAMCFVRLYSA